MELTGLVLRTLVVYCFVLLIFRFSGKGEVGKLSPFDLVVFVMMADLAVLALERVELPLLSSLVPITVLFVVQVLYSFISSKTKNASQGTTFHNVQWLSPLGAALLESSGRFSVVFSHDDTPRPAKSLILIEDGKVNHDNLAMLGQNVFWLKRQLKEQTGSSLFKNVSLCLWDDEGRLYIDYYDE